MGDKLSIVNSSDSMSYFNTEEINQRLSNSDTELQLDACLDDVSIDFEFIENNLDLNEKVSLIFLLYEEPNIALQDMVLITQGSSKKILADWSHHELKLGLENWRDKLLEALSILQCHHILRNLGYSKEDYKFRFLPFNKHTSLFINPTKKVLYRLCEDFSEEEHNFILNCFNRNSKSMLKQSDYLEMHFTYWETIFQENYLQNIIAYLKEMNKDSDYDILKDLYKKYSRSGNILDDFKEVSKQQDDLSFNPHIKMYDSPKKINTTNVDNLKYSINPKKPGLMLIINQKHFYLEPDPKYKNLLTSKKQLERRIGTEKDERKLLLTFKKLGFEVIIERDVTHFDFLGKIQNVVQLAEEYSCFFTCVLSHGIEGHVFGVNSIAVKVDSIADVMCQIKNKPKILLLQSCQGTECLQLETDGPSTSSKSQLSDLLIFWATVPGYAAVRHKIEGSWFIQILCDKILKLYETTDFEQICVHVQKGVLEKRWPGSDNIMNPIRQSTFSKLLYLPKVEKNM